MGIAKIFQKKFGYKGVCEEITLERGNYLLQVWGAQGGLCSCDDSHSRGGYSHGIIKLHSSQSFTVCVGGKGTNSSRTNAQGGFNGGGNSAIGSKNQCGGSGGGATDITLKSDNSQKIIIAGGGRGSIEYTMNENPPDYCGGYGGGASGGDGEGGKEMNLGKGGKTYEYDNQGKFEGTIDIEGTKGTLGKGGNGATTEYSSAGGGGGGYYGGGGGADIGSGGGGSGYVHWLVNGKTLSGIQKFPNPEGSYEIGHPGDGYAIITKLKIYSCGFFHYRNYNVLFILIAIIFK